MSMICRKDPTTSACHERTCTVVELCKNPDDCFHHMQMGNYQFKFMYKLSMKKTFFFFFLLESEIDVLWSVTQHQKDKEIRGRNELKWICTDTDVWKYQYVTTALANQSTYTAGTVQIFQGKKEKTMHKLLLRTSEFASAVPFGNKRQGKEVQLTMMVALAACRTSASRSLMSFSNRW